MLKPLEMSKIIVIGPDTEMEKTVKALHKMKIMHVVDHKKNELDIGTPLERANKLSEILIKTKSIISHLEVKQELNQDKLKELRKKKIALIKLERETPQIELELISKIKDIKDIENKIKTKQDMSKKLELLKPFNLNLESYSGYNSIYNFTGYINKINDFLTELKNITARYHLEKYVANKKDFIALFVEKNKTKEVQDLLNRYNFVSLNTSFISELKGDTAKYISRINNELSSLEKQKNRINNSLKKLGKEHSEALLLNEALLEEELEKAEAPLRFAKTKNAFVVNGWLPTKKVKKATEILEKITKKKIFIQAREIEKNDNIPVKLKNPDIVKPFEFFMDLYALPKYKEIDPTFFLFLTFPLLFGFMLGDMGYGLITLIVAWSLKKAIPKGRQLFDIIMFSALGSIFFGALFGEFLGFEELFGYELPHIFSRAHQLDLLLGISVLIGVLHLLTGLINGFINVYKNHGLKHAIYEKFGWILMLPGLIKLLLILDLVKGGLGNFVEILLPNNTILIALVVVGAILLFLGEGAIGLIEIPGIFGNVLSYARLMAIGLASVMLAIIINQYVTAFFQGGIFMIIAAILLLVVGHTVNIAVGLLGSFLHSLRLHYVEYFSKFFEGGAIKYKPFGVNITIKQ